MKTLLGLLKMGGFACYVWSAYGIVFFVLLLIIFQTKRKLKKMLAYAS